MEKSFWGVGSGPMGSRREQRWEHLFGLYTVSAIIPSLWTCSWNRWRNLMLFKKYLAPSVEGGKGEKILRSQMLTNKNYKWCTFWSQPDIEQVLFPLFQNFIIWFLPPPVFPWNWECELFTRLDTEGVTQSRCDMNALDAAVSRRPRRPWNNEYSLGSPFLRV